MLTPKEKEVLRLKKKGLRQLQIAAQLNISQPAVSNFYRNAMRKVREAKKVLEFAKEIDLEVDDE